jgi:hypothetical protein
MKILSFGSDGGQKSGVTGFWLFEFKSLFSIVILHFAKGTRENYHSHAFNAYTWFLSGQVEEQHFNADPINWRPSWSPKYTPKSCFHRVKALTDTYAISFRGPWDQTWSEYNPKTNEIIKLTHGREVLSKEKAT